MALIRGREHLQKVDLPPFEPLQPLTSGSAQTIAGRFWPSFHKKSTNSKSHRVGLPDGAKLVVVENESLTDAPVVVIVHGLSGCHLSSYMSRMASRFIKDGWHVYRVNMRNCGPGLGLSEGIYHSGSGDDVAEVMEWVANRHPHQELHLLGFSLGANISLNYLLRSSRRIPTNLNRAIVVAPPSDMVGTAVRITENRLFDRFFVKEFRPTIEAVRKVHAHWPELPRGIRLTEVDEILTAPLGGFESARDYYEKTSTARDIAKVPIPTLVLHAMDDPVIAGEFYKSLQETELLKLIVTEKGGHMGFLDSRFSIRRWMDELILRWWEI